jgi:curved DNA-binding protein
VPRLGNPGPKGSVMLRIPPGTQGGRVFRLQGMGMPKLRNPEQRGHLYAKVRVTVPINLSQHEKEVLEDLAGRAGGPASTSS